MWQLARATVRTHRAGFLGSAVVILLATALLAGTGVLLESGLRGGVPPARYRGVDVVVEARRSGATMDLTPPTERVLLDAAVTEDLARLAGVDRAAAEVTVPMVTADGGSVDAHDDALAALDPHWLVAGTPPERTGEVVLERGTAELGAQVVLSHGAVPRTYTVVGLVEPTGRSGRAADAYLAPTDIAGLWPHDGRVMVVGLTAAAGVSPGELASSVTGTVPGVVARTGADRGLAEFPDTLGARSSLVALSSSFAGVALVLALFVVASTLALSVTARRRQFALLRAVGATPRQVRGMVTREVAVVAALAAPVGAVIGTFAATWLRGPFVAGGLMPADFTLALGPLPALAATALVSGAALLAAVVTARHPARMSPVEAVRSAAVESPRLPSWRLVTAVVCLGLGLFAAGAPLIFGGMVGAAAAAGSALLVLVAVGLAGPPLVVRVIRAAGPVVRGRGSAPGVLAAANTAGFSRRFAAAIVPLAMVLALGCVQLFTTAIAQDAGRRQLAAGIGADLVVTAPAGGIDPGLAQQVAALPGVVGTTPMTTSTLHLMTDDEDPAGLGWESVTAQGVDPHAPADLLDVDVAAGDLADLAGPGTIALSTDAAAMDGLGLGSRTDLRFGDGIQTSVTVVATFARGLGFGDVLVDHTTLLDHTTTRQVGTLLVGVAGAERDAVAGQIGALGLTALDTASSTPAAAGADSGQEDISALMLLLLLAFVALAAANTLVTSVGERRAEFTLLHTVGATRSQIRRTTFRESLVIAAAAVLIGTLASAPALVGVSWALAGRVVPAVSWPVYLALAGGVGLLAVVSVAVPTRLALRTRAEAPDE